jgi:hypothetical protein
MRYERFKLFVPVSSTNFVKIYRSYDWDQPGTGP